MTAADVPIEFSKGEAANGQHEVNIRYDHVLESADRSVVFKHGAKEIAYLNGWGITFMAKPDHRWTGSSGHLHMSLWDVVKDTPLMHAAKGEPEGPYGLSEVGQQFMAGMMKLSRELAVFIAPFINSYKRYASLSWAPVNVVWGRDNRTTGFRLVGRGPALHVEDRFPGGDMNAYLTYAAMIGAGLYGIEHKLTLDPEFKGNGYLAKGVARMPRALYEAIGELERSEAAVEIFGQDVVDHYLNAARVEQETYDSVVHPGTASATLSAVEHDTAARCRPMTADIDALRRRVAELEAREAGYEHAAKVQDALYRIAEAASAVEDLPAFYATVHGIVAGLMYADNAYIALYDDQRQAINYPYYVDSVDTDIPDPNLWEPMGVGQATGMTAYALRTRQAGCSIEATAIEDLVARGEIKTLGVVGQGDWLGAPLVAEGRTLGVIVVQTYTADQLHTEADRDLLAFVGQHIGSALSRVRAIEETRQRNAELALVNEIGLALGRQLEFEAIIDLVGERLRGAVRRRVDVHRDLRRRDRAHHVPVRDRGGRAATRPSRSGSGRA